MSCEKKSFRPALLDVKSGGGGENLSPSPLVVRSNKAISFKGQILDLDMKSRALEGRGSFTTNLRNLLFD